MRTPLPDRLAQVLSGAEMERYESEGVVRVVGSAGGIYQIALHSITGNIQQFDEHDCWVYSWCWGPRLRTRPQVPGWEWNYFAAQVLALKADEPAVWKVAVNQGKTPCKVTGKLMPLTGRSLTMCSCGDPGCVEVSVTRVTAPVTVATMNAAGNVGVAVVF